MYELCTLCLEFGFWIVPKQIKLKIDETFLNMTLLLFEVRVSTSDNSSTFYVDSVPNRISFWGGGGGEGCVHYALIINMTCSILDFASVLDPSLNTIERL